MTVSLTGWLRNLLTDYRRTLKAPEVEEALDVVVYRPLAFLGVRALLPTSVTPNQITLLSILIGLGAGWLLGMGTPASMRWGALGVLLFNVLDCADGMLARARNLRSPIGYVLDGMAGYIGTAAIILGLGQAIASRHDEPLFWWACTITGMVSLAWWCAVVDGLRLEWMRRVHGQCQDRAAELARLMEQAEPWRRDGTHRGERILVACYAFYVRLWEGRSTRERLQTPEDSLPISAWTAANRPILRLAVWTGPTMQLTLMLAAGLFNRPEWLLWGALVVSNVWAAGVLLARLAIRQRLLAGSFEGA